MENSSKPMSEMDQETEEELARIWREWEQSEREGAALEARHAVWREALLAEADRQGMGERFRETLRSVKPRSRS